MMLRLMILYSLALGTSNTAFAFAPLAIQSPTKLSFLTTTATTTCQKSRAITSLHLSSETEEITDASTTTSSNDDNDDAKFGFGARIESIKCVVVGALSGGIALAPFSLVKDLVYSGQSVAQWEFDTDMGALEGALFAIVYRYCIREDTNPQLKDGVVGAFLLTRTLSRVQVPSYCSAVPLDCE